jgi:hypothetical protein
MERQHDLCSFSEQGDVYAVISLLLTLSLAKFTDTSIRYLTKISDQIVALISDTHAQGIVWDEEHRGDVSIAGNSSGRLFTFQVAKTREQEENVIVKPGFIVRSTQFVRYILSYVLF